MRTLHRARCCAGCCVASLALFADSYALIHHFEKRSFAQPLIVPVVSASGEQPAMTKAIVIGTTKRFMGAPGKLIRHKMRQRFDCRQRRPC
jgi:hypothetical protein